MKKVIFLSTLLLMGCSENVIVTKIHAYPADYIVKEIQKQCVNGTLDIWMELTEHHHFKCTNGFSEGERKCYGWNIKTKGRCAFKNGIFTTIEYPSLSFGNSDIHTLE